MMGGINNTSRRSEALSPRGGSGSQHPLIVRIRAPFTDAQRSQLQPLVWQQHTGLSLSFTHAHGTHTHTLGRSLLPASTLSGDELDWTIFNPIKSCSWKNM